MGAQGHNLDLVTLARLFARKLDAVPFAAVEPLAQHRV
jgi:hypothetical protein